MENSKNQHHRLVEAILGRDAPTVREICEGIGFDVNAYNFLGYTPLYQASVMINNSEIVRILLENGASPNFRTSHGTTPLAVALYLGHDRKGYSETIRILKHFKATV